MAGTPPLAAREGPADPTRQGCADLISTRGVQSVPLGTGSRFCVRTAAKRIAAVTVDSVAEYAYSATVTVREGQDA